MELKMRASLIFSRTLSEIERSAKHAQEKEETKNSYYSQSNKVSISAEDEQLILKARQRIQERGAIRVKIEDL